MLKNDLFTKTGSGRKWGKHSKKEMRFLGVGVHERHGAKEDGGFYLHF